MMIATELSSNMATVRIHDDYIDAQPEQRLSHTNRIISGYYQRKARAQFPRQRL